MTTEQLIAEIAAIKARSSGWDEVTDALFSCIVKLAERVEALESIESEKRKED